MIAALCACVAADLTAPGGEPRQIAGGGPVVIHETVPGYETAFESFDQGDVATFQELLFGDDIVVFELDVPDSSFDALVADPYTWVPADFVYQDVRYADVGLRCKGENSFLPFAQKCSLKVDFNKFADLEFMGLDELTLNNMSNDSSMMHERVAYRLYREFGVPASRSGHALVYLNGALYGLFAHVETVDIRLARQWFADDAGSMFEVHDVDFYEEYVSAFTLEFGEDDRSDIVGTTITVANLNGDAALEALEPFMNLDSFVDYWAVSAVVGQYDSYPFSWPGDDTHVYGDPTTGQLHWLPHGVDETFYDPYRDPHSVCGVVAATCLESADCTDQFHQRAWEAQQLAEDIDLLGIAREAAAQIEPWVAADTNKNHDTQGVYDEQEDMLDFIGNRRQDLEALIGAP